MNDILEKALLLAKSAEPLPLPTLREAMRDARLFDGGDCEALAIEVARILAFASVLKDFDGEVGAPSGDDAAMLGEKHTPSELLSQKELLARASSHDGTYACVPAVLS